MPDHDFSPSRMPPRARPGGDRARAFAFALGLAYSFLLVVLGRLAFG